jgi:hypothetical protein
MTGTVGEPKTCQSGQLAKLRTGNTEMENSQRWVIVRMVLGVLQMAGAISSVSLLFHSGLSALSLACVVVTSFLTTVSVFLFGSRPDKKKN